MEGNAVTSIPHQIEYVIDAYDGISKVIFVIQLQEEIHYPNPQSSRSKYQPD